MSWKDVTEETALAHAARGGHNCGREQSLRVFALATLEAAPSNATDVFVTPEATFVQFEDRTIRFRNSPEMIEALDRYLLTGDTDVLLGEFELLAPDPEEES